MYRFLPEQLVTGLLPVAAGVLAYLLLATLLRIPEAQDLLSLVWSRPERSSGAET